jgi:hypothetical protein
MKRYDLLGGPDCFFNIRDHDEGNKANKPSLEDNTDNALSQNSAHLRHVEAMAKKNHRQQMSAIKARKQCGKEVLGAGAGIGVVVSLKIDYCTQSHVQGLLAIVAKSMKIQVGSWFAVSMESSLMMEQAVTTGFCMTSIRLLQKRSKWYQFKMCFRKC